MIDPVCSTDPSIRLKTGFNVSIIEGLEENRLTFIAVNDVLTDLSSKLDQSNSVIIEVGGGSTELMLLQEGKMVAAHSLKIGTVRAKQQIGGTSVSPEQLTVFLRENIRTVKEVLANEFSLDQVQNFIAVGGDARTAAREVGKKTGTQYNVITKDAFDGFITSVHDVPADELSAGLGIPYADAEGLAAALEIYRLFLESTSADQLIVPNVSIRDGILLEALGGSDMNSRVEFESQILASAESLGRKYHFDIKHARHVTFLALSLFDQLEDEHGIGAHGRRQLQIASLLHDIGTYISTSGHHKHSQYLVANSEIFGLRAEDIDIISNVVRYHRKAQPSEVHAAFRSLSRSERMTVMKLSAMLRVADALDRSHVQRITSLTAERAGDTLHLHAEYTGDLSVERYGLQTKGAMFEEVFGVTALLD